MTPTIKTESELVQFCKDGLRMLHAVNNLHGDNRIALSRNLFEHEDATQLWHLYFASPNFESTQPFQVVNARMHDQPATSLIVTSQLLGELDKSIASDTSELRWASSWPINRTFVYLDISDFSTDFSPGQQILILNSLGNILKDPTFGTSHFFGAASGGPLPSFLEAMICVGDGYVFACRNTSGALILASLLAMCIEQMRADQLIVPFYFRMGIHVGEVNRFWDIGRKDWNYMGDGIIGSRRVLEAIGKDIDNVIFVSDAVQNAILQSHSQLTIRASMLGAFSNRGRRYDKHRRAWRVYELDHMKLTPPGR